MTTIKQKYPEGVFTICFMQMFSMVGFSMLFALLTLYCVHVLHFPDHAAYDISEAFNAEVFALSIFGGLLANRWMGYRLSFVVSGLLAILGYIFLLTKNIQLFYFGLGMYVLSQAIMVPSMYVLLGMLYDENDSRRHSGFILAYMSMNVGSLFASIVSGPVSESYGYHAAFFIGLVFCCITLANYLVFQYKIKPRQITKITKAHSGQLPIASKISGVLLTLIFVPFVSELMKHAEWNNTILIILGCVSSFVVLVIAFKQTKSVRNKMLIFLFLSLISVFFWGLYLLAPTVLPLFTERNIHREIFGYVIPAASFSALNPFFIVSMGPLLSLFWLWLGRRGKQVSTANKFALGLLLMGSGYLLLMFSVYTHNPLGYICLGWLVGSYFLQTVGELCIGPIGFAMVGELVPADYEGFMMGVWQLMTGVSGVLTDYLSHLTNTLSGNVTNPELTDGAYAHLFLVCGSLVLSVGLLMFFMTRWIKKVV